MIASRKLSTGVINSGDIGRKYSKVKIVTTKLGMPIIKEIDDSSTFEIKETATNSTGKTLNIKIKSLGNTHGEETNLDLISSKVNIKTFPTVSPKLVFIIIISIHYY